MRKAGHDVGRDEVAHLMGIVGIGVFAAASTAR